MSKKSGKPILSLDFDGVVHSYTSGWQGPRTIPDPAVPGAIRFIVEASEHFQVAIFSSRGQYWGGRRAMRLWLHQQAVKEFSDINPQDGTAYANWFWSDGHMDPFDIHVYDKATELVEKLVSWPRHKPPALVGLDDRVLTFEGDWPDISELRAFRPWNRRG